LSTQPKYSTQGASHRRTEDAILSATKELISEVGLSAISMIEISHRSQVARATLYNHFRDKSAVIEALLQSEVSRILQVASVAGTPADALESLSIAISQDQALAGIRQYDQALLSGLMTHSEHPLYLDFARVIYAITKSEVGTGLAMHWLLGQVAQPISIEHSHDQSQLLVENTLF
jgi:AcrR family transcriptional regulator